MPTVRPLTAADLELLATSAYMLDRDDEYLRALERALHSHLDAGDVVRAARCAFWLGVGLAFGGRRRAPRDGPGAPGGWSRADHDPHNPFRRNQNVEPTGAGAP